MKNFKRCTMIVFCAILVFASTGYPLSITCEGTACTSNPANQGLTRYEYTLKNISDSSVTLGHFQVGTKDLDSSNYTNWTTPSGMSSFVSSYENWAGKNIPTAPNTVSQMYTSGTFTQHSGTLPGNGMALPGGIEWYGSLTIAPGATATFGFDNIHSPQDVEWITGDPVPGNTNLGQGQWNSLVANPTTFTDGYVHSPVPEPATVCLLGLGGLLLRRRKRN